MQYITHKRFKGKAICGDINIPAKTICEANGTFITLNGKRICAIRSENANRFFSRNDDGYGLVRGNITREIVSILNKRDDKYQIRWDAVWNDPICYKYKRKEHKDHWLWNTEFFNAPIEDLEYIKLLITKAGKRRIKMFYKVTQNGEPVDIIENPRFVIWLSKSRRFLKTDINSANGVVASDCHCVYHIDGKPIFENFTGYIETAVVEEITEVDFYKIKIYLLQKQTSNISEKTSSLANSNAQLEEELRAAKILLGVE